MPVYNNKVKNKLLVMFFIKTMNTPLLGYQIEEYFVDNVMIELMELHSIIAELTESGFIKELHIPARTYYVITEKGVDALQNLESDLTETPREFIKDYCKENRSRIVNENNVLTSCRQNVDGMFEMTLTVLNNVKPLMELKIAVEDEEFALRAVKNWASRSNEAYSAIVNILFREDITEEKESE